MVNSTQVKQLADKLDTLLAMQLVKQPTNQLSDELNDLTLNRLSKIVCWGKSAEHGVIRASAATAAVLGLSIRVVAVPRGDICGCPFSGFLK